MGKPRGTIFEILFETTSDQSFMEWSIATDMTKHVKIVVSPVTQTSKSRVIELYDVHCVYFKNNFNAQNGEPMTTLIHLTPAIMIDDGRKVLDHYWKKTDLSANAPVTVLNNNEEEESKIIDYYIIGEDGTRITDFRKGLSRTVFFFPSLSFIDDLPLCIATTFTPAWALPSSPCLSSNDFCQSLVAKSPTKKKP